jgi:4,5-DOPA dioxygenase extradiol
MHRKTFIKASLLLSLSSCMIKIKELQQLSESLPNTEKMPVLFLGHGSPMNAIEENEFVAGFRRVGGGLRGLMCLDVYAFRGLRG